MSTSLWCNMSNSKYSDSEISESVKKTMKDSNPWKTYTVDYNGQKSRRRDHLVGKGCHFFVKTDKNAAWDLLGVVSICEEQPERDTDGTRIFSLTIKSVYNRPLSFRTKNMACEFFKCEPLNSFERTHGIIEH